MRADYHHSSTFSPGFWRRYKFVCAKHLLAFDTAKWKLKKSEAKNALNPRGSDRKLERQVAGCETGGRVSGAGEFK